MLQKRYFSFIFCFLLLFSSIIVVGQRDVDRELYFKGRVLDSERRSALYNVHVINKSTRSATVSRHDGSFTIRASDGDTIHFSMVGYQHNDFRVQAAHLESGADVVVLLYFDFVTLSEVSIYGKTFDQFREDFKSLHIVPHQVNQLAFSKLEKELDLLKSSSAIQPGGGPIQFLYDYFNKKSMRARNLQRYRKSVGNPSIYDLYPLTPADIPLLPEE